LIVPETIAFTAIIGLQGWILLELVKLKVEMAVIKQKLKETNHE
jgi:hypothetical protein